MGKQGARAISRKAFLAGAGVSAVAAAGSIAAIESARAEEAAGAAAPEEEAPSEAEAASAGVTDAYGAQLSPELDGDAVATSVTAQDYDEVNRGSYQVNMRNVEPFPAIAEPGAYDYETDVLALGYGAGGTNAALTCVNRGVSFVAMERSTRELWHEHAGIAWSWTYGAPEWLEHMGYSRWDEEFVREWVLGRCKFPISEDDLATAVRYFVEMPKSLQQVREADPPATDMELFEVLPSFHDYPNMTPVNRDGENFYHRIEVAIDRKAEEAGAVILWGVRATNLIVDEDGAVVGAKGVDPEGNIVYVKAKAVIDCIGGYGGNYDLTKFLNGAVDQVVGMNVGTINNDGAGIRMCQGAGAGLRGAPRADDLADAGIDTVKFGLPWNLVNHDPNVPGYINGHSYVPLVMGRQPTLKVNKYGKRFMDEDGTWGDKAREAYKQPEHRFFAIFGGNFRDQIYDLYRVKGRWGACENPYQIYGSVYWDDDKVYPRSGNWEEEWQDGIDKGLVVQADTLEELAEKCGIDVDNFVATVARYNQIVAMGVDVDYGKRSECLYPIDEPPYYALERMPAFAWAEGSVLACDGYGRVLSTSGKPISGLYCGANDASLLDYGTGLIFDDNLICGGAAHAIAMGYISATTACDDVLAGGEALAAVVENEPTGKVTAQPSGEAALAGKQLVDASCNLCHSAPSPVVFSNYDAERVAHEFSSHAGVTVSDEDARAIASWELGE